MPLLKNKMAHVWAIDYNKSKEWYVQCLAALDEQQLKRCNHFKFEHDRKSYVISQGSLKLLLAAYLNIPVADVRLGRHRKGKPFSMDNPALEFNLSNSGTVCVMAFCPDSALGIDLESIKALPSSDYEDLIQRNFTDREKQDILKHKEDQLRFFYQYWTMKEAYLKAIGEGMRLTPDQVEFSLEEGVPRLLSANGDTGTEDWLFHCFVPSAKYIGTLAYTEGVKEVQYWRL